MNTQDFLFELGTEELPPKSLKALSDSLVSEVKAGLADAGLDCEKVIGYAAPRRLAVLVTQLQAQQADRPFEKRGPAVKAAYDKDGNPSKAAQGFARSCGVEFSDLTTLSTDKGDYLAWSGVEPGQATTSLLPGILDTALNRLPIAKRMRWGANRYEFVRPVKWLLALWGEDTLPYQAFGLQAGNLTFGHRIHAPEGLHIAKPTDYAARLKEQGWVLADFQERQTRIEENLNKAAEEHGVTPVAPADLLEEVTSLNEWPVVMSGQFDESFLSVPPEALISSMQEHQKYFASTDQAGKLTARFFFVANLESSNPSVVINGNEKVIRPRLADAAFFWESDQKQPLVDRLPKLDKVIFQKQLGSVGQKSRRISKLAGELATLINADADIAARAGLLAKADLVTDLVFEFDDLQGLAGAYYAEKDGEPEGVAHAIRDHYKPGFAGDTLPSSPEGWVVAMADRLDTLIGIFGVGQKPTGTKDPFALRRASLGVLRILMENRLDLDLRDLLVKALNQYPAEVLPARATVVEDTLAYMLERLRAVFQDQGIPVDVFYAVRALELTRPMDIQARVDSVKIFRETDAGKTLSEANKRVANLLSKAGSDIERTEIDLLTDASEISLMESLESVEERVTESVDVQRYDDALSALSTLKDPLDQFFEKVMVMADDEQLRMQRLGLLSRIRKAFLQVADVSLLQR